MIKNTQPNYYFIVNMNAGAKHSERTWQTVRMVLEKHKVDFEFVMTEYPHHATELARQYASEHQENVVIVAVGGDGTLLEVLEGVRYAKNQLPIGYIPAGSGNDFARSVGIENDATKATEQLLSATASHQLDIGVYQDISDIQPHYFTNNVGVGFDARIVHVANSSQKEKLSKWHLESSAYISAILRTFFAQKGFPLTIKVDNESHSFKNAFLVSMTNIHYFGGGVKIAPQASLTDGKLDVVIVEKLSIFRLARIFKAVFTNGTHLQQKNVFFKQAKQVEITSETDEYGQVNGEDLPKKKFHMKLWVEQQPFWFA